MTTINERVKMIRKSDKLNRDEKMTLERFGARLGVQKSAISKIENGQVALSDQMFTAICREFSVNPDWLRDGTGEMFLEKTRNQQIEDFIGDILTNEPDGVKARLISSLARLDEDAWANIAEVARALSEHPGEGYVSATEHLTAFSDEPAADPADDARARLHAELDRQLDLEEEAAGNASASTAS